MPYLIFVLCVSGVLLVFWLKRIRHFKHRAQLLQQALPPDQLNILRESIPLYDKLPSYLQRELQGLVIAFLAEKQFEGCGGQAITPEIKIAIAAQACLLLLNRPTTLYPKLKTILVYPHTYVGTDESGGHSARLGESWQNGPVVLAWDSVHHGAVIHNDGKNVVLHEFAHQLDQEDGAADGAPILANRTRYRHWARVLGHEYDRLRYSAQAGRRSILDKYGATNPAEFFAVASETFFEKPEQLQNKHPELYEELKTYYHLDPLQWGT